MSESISKQTYTSLLPPGPLGEPKTGGDLDKLLDGMATNADLVAAFMADIAHIRNPNKTPTFEDLEREYGIKPNSTIAMSDRIMRLARKVYQGEKIDSPDDLQDALDAAGFNLQVHLNDPPVDPALFLEQLFQMVAGGDNAYAAFEPLGGPPSTAFAGILGGELLVNGDIFLKSNAVEMQAGGDIAFAGYHSVAIPNYQSSAGFFSGIAQDLLGYSIPDSEFWNMVYFVGGDATRDPVTDELTAIEQGFVDSNRRNDLRTTILEIRPLMAWCGLIITFT